MPDAIAQFTGDVFKNTGLQLLLLLGPVLGLAALMHWVSRLVRDRAYDLLGRGQALEHVLSDSPNPHRFDEILDDPKIHVGFKQNQTDFPQSLLDIILGQASVATELLENRIKFFRQVVKHPDSHTARSGYRQNGNYS